MSETISFQQVTKKYPFSGTVLDNLTMSIKQGEFVFVAGASGAGKSTLLKLILGAESPSEGTITVFDKNLSSLSERELSITRRDISTIFQDFKLLKRYTVTENVALPLSLSGVRKRDRDALAKEALSIVDLQDKALSFPETLSGGEQQRVAIARALISRPKVILADEPTGNLDPKMTRIVFDLLLDAHAKGVTVITASHNLGIIEELKLRTVILDKGKVIGDFKAGGGF